MNDLEVESTGYRSEHWIPFTQRKRFDDRLREVYIDLCNVSVKGLCPWHIHHYSLSLKHELESCRCLCCTSQRVHDSGMASGCSSDSALPFHQPFSHCAIGTAVLPSSHLFNPTPPAIYSLLVSPTNTHSSWANGSFHRCDPYLAPAPKSPTSIDIAAYALLASPTALLRKIPRLARVLPLLPASHDHDIIPSAAATSRQASARFKQKRAACICFQLNYKLQGPLG